VIAKNSHPCGKRLPLELSRKTPVAPITKYKMISSIKRNQNGLIKEKRRSAKTAKQRSLKMAGWQQ
jgi:hypothetical protein